MSSLNNRYLYDNSKIVRFDQPRIDALDIRLYFPTEHYKISTIMKTITLEMVITIDGISLTVIKAIGYELPACIDEFKDLKPTVMEFLLDVVKSNLIVNETAGHSDMTVRFLLQSFDGTLKIIAGASNIDEMSLDHIKLNKPLCLSASMAMTKTGGVGYNNLLPWWIPDELVHFRKLTLGKMLICGSKTYTTMGSLPGRILLVMTGHGKLPVLKTGNRKGLTIPVSSYTELLGVLATMHICRNNEVVVIGGPTVLSLFTKQFDVLNLTTVCDTKLRNPPNVFIDTSIEFYLSPSYSDCGTTSAGDGWTAKRFIRN